MTNFNQMPYSGNPYSYTDQYLGNYSNNLNQSNMNTATNQYRPQVLFGKTVNSQQDILPQDVPMNGMTSYFPKADGSV